MVDVDEVFGECIKQVEKTDGTSATADTADFLDKLVGPDSQVCCVCSLRDQ